MEKNSMKKYILIIVAVLVSLVSVAQIPYYSGSQGKGKTYTYFSTKFHPGENNQQMYITAQYGVLSKIDLVTDATIGTNFAYQGFGTRFNILSNKYFGLGGQIMVDFDINNSYKFNYNCNSLYMNGSIVGGLHWVSNTWWTVYKGADNVVEHWGYLGYTVGKFTPMVGIDNYITNSIGSDLLAGFYISHKKMNFYLWGSNLTKNFGDRRVVVGFDYKF